MKAKEFVDFLVKAEAEQYTCVVPLWDGATDRVNYEALFYRRIPLLKLAFSGFDRNTTCLYRVPDSRGI